MNRCRPIHQFAIPFMIAALFLAAGPRPVAAGLVDVPRSLKVGGVERTYRLHVPPAYDGVRPLPLLLLFHGGGGQGAGMARLSGMNQVADRNGFLVAYPDGLNRHWNDGRSVVRGADDDAFVRALIDDLSSRYKVDPRRIYATGISNGGFFSEHLVCAMPDRIAAAAMVAATMSVEQYSGCRPGRAVPVLFILGVEDPLVPWQGGTIGLKRGPIRQLLKDRGKAVSAAQSVAYWVKNNGCSPVPAVSVLPDADPRDGTRIRKEAYQSTPGGAPVVLYAIDGGGHCWPGGRQYLPERIIGRTSRDINASEVIWEFFAGQSLR